MKRPSNNVIGMAIVIVLLVVCIITRWDYISTAAAEAFKGLFSR